MLWAFLIKQLFHWIWDDYSQFISNAHSWNNCQLSNDKWHEYFFFYPKASFILLYTQYMYICIRKGVLAKSEERTIFFTSEKKNVRLESRTKYFTCAKNDTSNQKPPQCVSFAPSLPLFMGTVSSVLELLCTPETSLRASFPERSGVRKGKGRRACNYVSKIWISASKKSMRNADWRRWHH